MGVATSNGASIISDYKGVYTFSITNLGANTDSYTLTTSSKYNWANLSSIPDAIELPSNMSMSFPITLTVPVTVPQKNVTEEITLLATSRTNPLISDIAIAQAQIVVGTEDAFLPIILK